MLVVEMIQEGEKLAAFLKSCVTRGGLGRKGSLAVDHSSHQLLRRHFRVEYFVIAGKIDHPQ
jgi:hypothetical protein